MTMKDYINTIKNYLDTEISIISIGPDREDTIVLNQNAFFG